ncbi:MATH domain and coiled-coil domain-containing protein At3g44790-like isoform X4 [Morus notabilis]|uniref:MATH domain and coiled-coil domain-containing protein At3g44790-like isoform X4 n=1 Tax=Morus notabilis TaxID=981085 RepID=UPI000CED1529|nr:MATH domain and coiled-coil domain-containing protein At3g44790-like isoform X4 [Morus notabilis]XP_024017460.1 MATH domain and coiled-coil domain-containing protein At3g44790-like isoform X4 [Morus notabilis]XP_024017461.1 MATH domain and coiled-coil domain-containing protein At3g44790-like isoform X4 [Morus notabilis]
MEVHEFSCTRCRWTIDNFSNLDNKKLCSDIFSTGGYKWRILIFPKAYNVDYLSIYLKVPDLATLPKGWSRDAQFSFSVVNQIDSKNTIKIDAQHVFNARKSVWGYNSFIPLSKLSSAKGFILKDTCIIEAEVRLKRNEEDEARLDTVKKSVEAQEEQSKDSKPTDSQDEIPDVHGSEHPLISVNVPLPLEQSKPSAKIKEQSEQEPVLEKTRVRTQAEDDPFYNNENPITRSTVLESEEVSSLKVEDTQEETKMVVTGQSIPLVNQSSAEPPGEPTVVEAGKRSSSFAEFDKLFTDIQNLLGGESSTAKNFSSFLPPPCSIEEIADAKKFFKQCLNMSLASVIQMDKAPMLKNSLSIMLTTGRFPSNMGDRTTKFLADIDQSCETYELAKQDIGVAQEDEMAVGELKTALNQLFSEFIALRNQAETVDREIANLEKQMAERTAKKAQLSKRLEDLAGRATTSKQALVSAEEKMRLSAVKKEQAEKKIGDMERSWESLKVDCSLSL